MLNITIVVVPGQPNQITAFTSTASQHSFAFRPTAKLMLIFQEPWERSYVSLDLRRLIGISLRASGAYEERMNSLRRGAWLIRAHLWWGSSRVWRWITVIWGRETVKRSQNGALCKGWRGDILQKALEGMHKGVWSCDRMEAKLKECKAAQRLHTGKHCS